MASYGNFQSDNKKYTNKSSRVNVNNPDFTPSVSVVSNSESLSFAGNLKKWMEVVAYYRFNPDLWYDLITPETGGIKLDLDQRVLLRLMARFPSVYAVYNRGYSKTMLMVMSKIHRCVFYPNSNVTLTAQTKERSAQNLKEKYEELIRFYPLLKEEIYQAKFSKDMAEIEFHNGSRYNNLANNAQSKGMRRHAGDMDEDNLTDESVFLDALEPIFNVPRRTVGRKGLIDPQELNGQINFFTSAGWRLNAAYYRCRKHLEGMINLTGDMCIGAGWKLGAFYGRGESISSILNKKESLTATAWAMNYESHWTGATDSALVSSAKLMACRNLNNYESHDYADGEYVLGVDVARSDNSRNNQTVITVLKVTRHRNGKLREICIVNIVVLEGVLDFHAQAIELKKLRNQYNAQYIVIDENGLGRGLTDLLVFEQFDPLTGESLGCYDTINSERVPEISGSPKIVFCYMAQKYDNESIGTFIEMVETGKLRLLVQKSDNGYNSFDDTDKASKILPYLQTNFLVEEIINLRLKHLSNGNLSIEKVVKKVDKDRFSSLQYGLWFINKYMSVVVQEKSDELEELSKYIMW